MVQLGNVQVLAVKNAEVDEGLWSFIGFLHDVSGFGGEGGGRCKSLNPCKP